MKEVVMSDVLMSKEENKKLLDLFGEWASVRKEEIGKYEKLNIDLKRLKNKRLKVTISGKCGDCGYDVIGNMVIGKTTSKVFW